MVSAPHPDGDGSQTADPGYEQRLRRLEGAWWKRALDVQRPYRWNLRRLDLGRVLDVGCGIGRNLVHLQPGSVGVDHNADSVATATARGVTALTTEEFWSSALSRPGSFDSLLLAHLVEHVDEEVADRIVQEYLPCLRTGGQVVFITPQERGYRSDPTHVRFVDIETLRRHASAARLRVRKAYSFPFPRVAGKVFTYNEFVLVAAKG